MDNSGSGSSVKFKVHPAIGIARLGNSDEFYIAPEQLGDKPIQCDSDGVELRSSYGSPLRVSNYKEEIDLSKVKRQAARFRIFAYRDSQADSEEEIKIGAVYPFLFNSGITAPTQVQGTVTDIKWTVHLANKKSSWYEFKETQGMHGYSESHPLRNPQVTEPNIRRQLIIDPGAQTVSLANARKSFTKGKNPGYPQTFPPMGLEPNDIKTLGELIANKQDDHPRLIVLGGRGNSGSTETPVISSFVNNNGWFDDISDGPVSAEIYYSFEHEYYEGDKKLSSTQSSSMTVDVPAWVVVGYPRYVPEMADMITLDEAIYDLSVRQFQYQPQIFGVAPFNDSANSPSTPEQIALWRNNAGYNPDYYPRFYRDIWPVLQRPDLYQYTYDFDSFSGSAPHNTGTGGNLDEKALSQPPENGCDQYLEKRQFILRILRQPMEENLYFYSSRSGPNPDYKPRLMPMLCGNNPISNTSPDKFLKLTLTQLFFLRQWAEGKFINEKLEWGESRLDSNKQPSQPSLSAHEIDRGVLSNMLGGAFCPGGELSWIVTNPAIFSEPYRIKHSSYTAGGLSLPAPVAAKDGSAAADLSQGMEPGDMTKYIGIPWQADFHECSTQDIDITYDNWNSIDLASVGDPAVQQAAIEIPWWPAHRPIVVRTASGRQVYWGSGIPDNKAGDLRMVEAWNQLGFIKKKSMSGGGNEPLFYQDERNDAALGEPVAPGKRILGRSKTRKNHDT